MRRAPTELEASLVKRVAERIAPLERAQLLSDFSHANVELFDTGSAQRIVFHIDGYERPPYHGQHSFGAAGDIFDRDGAKISFDLYADENGRLLELELIRWGDHDIIEPNLDTLVFY